MTTGQRRRPTIRDVARAAGVSVATVSRVTHDDPKVTAGTRLHVQRVIDDVGYVPSPLGRSLAGSRSHVLGVVLPGLGGPYFAELLQGAESVVVEQGIAINVLGTHLRPDAERSVRDLAARTDGLIVAGGTISEALVAELARSTRVVVVAGRSEVAPSVSTDGAAAAEQLTAHLTDVHGYRRLRFLGESEGSPDAAARYRGFRAALAGRGLTEAGEPLRHGMEVRAGAVAARTLHERGELPEALVCGNDELATGVLATLPGLGYRLPEDVAITGFDDQALAGLASPRLTTVHQPIHDLGARAAAIALSTDPVDAADVARSTVLETRLVVRESCGCGPGRSAA